MSYFLAPSLVALRDEVNARWPKRDKASDGWIGDTSHAARKSSHNPLWSAPGKWSGVVRAIDVDNNGKPGEETALVKALLEATIGDHRVWYVIWNGHIWSRTYGWAKRRYYGSNPHDKHVHVSIEENADAWADTTRWLDDPKEIRPGPANMTLRLAVTNIPRKVGEKNWRTCFELMADRADIFGANEIGSAKAKAVMLKLTRDHKLRQYGTRGGPNPIFYNPRLYRRRSARHIRLHGAGTGARARRYPGFNDARYLTELVLRPRSGGPDVAVLNTHLVPNGAKVPVLWRRAVRKASLIEIRSIVREHRKAGRIVVLLGDTNLKRPFFVVRGWRWLRGTGIDKLGVLTTDDRQITKAEASTYPAPTDHKRGVRARVTFTRRKALR
ncbi:hypothetical protein [Nocardioides sp. J54]|uniref:hypothetical protein n=1 Tax=Nocardioides sp. J54 TaxID=935866 RepID=UPI0004B0C8AB|nr:hypothetical protein [Nocardioides sp. J54]